MTITQLEYTIAVATYQSFVAAAEKCFVTQPTLSMQIAKLEDELGVKIFDRNKQPITLTKIGASIVEQAKKVISETNKIGEIIKDQSGIVSGEFTLAVIPTIASSMVPQILKSFSQRHKEVTLIVKEMQTTDIIQNLINGKVDCGLLSTPLEDNRIIEYPIFEEQLVVYLHAEHPLLNHKTLSIEQLDLSEMWMMNEGNCLRNQILNFCAEHIHNMRKDKNYRYESGNINTLQQMVSLYGGFSIIPELIAQQSLAEDYQYVRYFDAPIPVREISLATSQNFFKKTLLKSLMEELLRVIPEQMKIQKNNRKVLRIQSNKL